MRVRPSLLIAAIFGAAALVAAWVVTQLPREGEVSAPAAAPEAAAPPAPSAPPGSPGTPPVDAPATARDGTLAVRVTAGGEPQAGAEVRLYVVDAAGSWRRAGEARTAADGAARLFARPGVHLVAVRAAGLAPARVEVARVAGEEVTHADVALEQAVSMEGRATTRGAGPVAGARVRVVPVVSRWPGFSPPSAPEEEIATAASDAAGLFRVEGLAPGSYAVEVDAPGRHPVLLARVAVPSDALAIALEPLARLEGTVRLGDGRPAAGALVRAASADHGATATADGEGRFALAAPAGSYRVVAARGDLAGAAAAPVSLAQGKTRAGLELRLGPAAVLEGEVRAAGRAAAGARIAVFAHETRERIGDAVADAAGRFRVDGLPPGPCDVRAAAPGASPALASAVTLAAGARFPLRLALAGTGSAEGTVRDTAGGPMAGVRVRVVQRGDGLSGAAPLEARSGFDGAFRIDGVEEGRAELVARQDGVALGAGGAVRVVAGRASRVDLFLPEAGLLVGRVRRGDGLPPAGTTVVATPLRGGLGGAQVARAPTDATGNYRLALPAGEYRVHAGPAGLARTDLRAAPAFARVDPARTSRLDLAAASGADEEGVEILVLEPGGAPSPGAVVTLARPDDGKVAFATSAGDDGRVVLGREMGVAGRRVVVRARNGGRTGEVALDLPPSGTVPVALAPGGAVQGVVRGGGRSVTGFTVEVASQPAASSWRTVDVHRFAGDRFELADLPAEPLRLLVRADDGRRGAADLRVAGGEVRAIEIALDR